MQRNRKDHLMGMNNEIHPDNVYLNIQIGNDGNSQLIFSPAVYEVTKNTPVVTNMSDYYLSVIDFVIPLSTIPIFIAKTIPDPGNPANINYMAAAVSIIYLGVEYVVHLTYVPANNAPLPKIPNSNDVYYYVYSYTQQLSAFNVALQQAWNDAGNPGGAGLKPPYFNFDAKSGLINLIVSSAFISSGATIQYNDDSYTFLQSFDYFYDYNNPLHFRFNFYNQGNICNENGANVGIVGGTYFIYTSQYYSLQDWVQLRKIFITSNSFPTFQEYVSVTSPFGQTSLNPSVPILFDFTPKFNLINTAGVVTYYESTNQYRLIDLQSHESLFKINIQVGWQDHLGVINQLYIGVGQSLSIKLGFLKKSLYKNYWPHKCNLME